MPFSDEPLGRQFALSESMLARLQEIAMPMLRWYAPREMALALGNGQKLAGVDLAACQAQGVAVYRRSSGGAAVLVDSTAFNLDIALPTAHPLPTTDVVLAYRWVGEALAQAMRNLGVTEARAIPAAEVRALPPLAPDDPLRLACYGTLSPWEVVVPAEQTPDAESVALATPRKLVGLCQVRRRGGALFQVGFYRRFDAQTLATLLAIPDDSRRTFAPRLAAATAGLRASSPRRHPHKAAQIMRAVEYAIYERSRSGGTIDSGWSDTELMSADRLERERFGRIV